MGASPVRPIVRGHVPPHQLGRSPVHGADARGGGYQRGVQARDTTLVIAVAANVANMFVELLFVYGPALGVAGSRAARCSRKTAPASRTS